MLMRKYTAFLSTLILILSLTSCVEDARRAAPAETADTSYILTIEGEKIDIQQFIYFVLFQTVMLETSHGRSMWDRPNVSFDDLKDTVLDSFIDALVAERYAARNGIPFTQSDMDEARASAEINLLMLQYEMGIEIPIPIEALALRIKEDMLLNALMNQLTERILTVGDEDFETFYDIQFAGYEPFLRIVNVNYVLTTDLQTAFEARQRFESGDDGFAVHSSLSIDYNPDDDVEVFTHLPALTVPFITEAAGAGSLALFRKDTEAGFVTDIMDISPSQHQTLYLVVRVEESREPDNYDGFRAEMVDHYVPYFIGQRLQQWRFAFNIQINQAAFDGLSLADIHKLF
jgi:hypothetical protein